MSWKKTWKNRRKIIPNRLKTNPSISFRFNSDPEILGRLKMLARGKNKSEFINRAISMRYYFLNCKKRFISDIIKENFQLVKHLLREEGSRRNAVTKE